MSVYAILSKEPPPPLRLRLERHYRGLYYHWSSAVAFLETDDSTVEISDKLGIAIGQSRRTMLEEAGEAVPDFEDPIQHTIVIKLAADYWGHTEMAMWEWLKTSFEEIS